MKKETNLYDQAPLMARIFSFSCRIIIVPKPRTASLTLFFLKLWWTFSTSIVIRHHFGNRAHKLSWIYHLLLFYLRNEPKNLAQRLFHLEFRDTSFAVKSGSSVDSVSPWSYKLSLFCPQMSLIMSFLVFTLNIENLAADNLGENKVYIFQKGRGLKLTKLTIPQETFLIAWNNWSSVYLNFYLSKI